MHLSVQCTYRVHSDVYIVHQDSCPCLLATAARINKRERTKQQKNSQLQKNPTYEIFAFGELKVFNWILVLYSHFHSIDLAQFREEHIAKLQTIFKKKSKVFIEYNIQDLIHAKKKTGVEWAEDEINMLREIVMSKEDESEWKVISYSLFRKSNGTYFKSFSMCREKWISHLNPNVKKSDWNVQEDVELFMLIQNYGCRWALISRELKGIRSEHTVKNRYHCLLKSIKRQYRLGDTNQLNEKILKYLKMKLEKEKEREVQISSLNSSGYSSMGSKDSRQRSREEEKLKLNRSEDSSQGLPVVQQPFNVFDDVYQLDPLENSLNQSDQSYQQFALKNYYDEFKLEKKTNDQDEDEEPTQPNPIEIKFDREESASVSEVKTSTIEELDREYNRLLNFTDGGQQQSAYFLDDNFDNNLQFGAQEGWLMNNEKAISWEDLDQ